MNLQVGGTVGLDKFYLVRNADTELPAALREGIYCFVLAPRQMGKSSLRVRAEQALAQANISCVTIDLSEFTDRDIAPEEFYFGLLERVATQLGLEDPVGFWEEKSRLAPIDRFFTYVRRVALSRTSKHVVVFIDEIDAMLSLARVSRDGFFAALRALYNARASGDVEGTNCQRLTVCLLGVAQPGDLIEDETRTPFNIGRAVVLQDFTRAELAPLGDLFPENGAALLDAIHAQTAGHPAMTMKLCIALLQPGTVKFGTEQAVPAEHVALLVHSLFLVRGQVPEPSLAYAEKHFDRGIAQARFESMLRLYGRLRRGHVVAARPDPVQLSLLLTGMVALRNGRLEVRNAIFAAAFDEAWVKDRETERLFAGPLANWLSSGHKAEHLLSDSALKAARAWAEGRDDISPDERAFLLASSEAVQRQKGQRVLLGVLTSAMVLLSGLLGVALVQYRHAVAQTAEARRARDNAAMDRKRAEESATEAQRQSESAKESARKAGLQEEEALRQEARAREALLKADEARGREQTMRIQAEEAAGVERGLRAAALGGQADREEESLVLALQAVTPPPGSGRRPLMRAAEGLVVATGAYLIPERTGSEHTDVVFSAKFSPDGSRVVSASADGTARVWDVRNSRALLTLRGHTAAVLSAAFSPDGLRIVSASWDTTVRIWSARDARPLLTLRGHTSAVLSATFSPDGSRLVSASSDGSVRVWDASNGRTLFTIPGHGTSVGSAAYSPDGSRIVTAGEDGAAHIRDARNGQALLTLSGHGASIASAEYSPDGARVITASHDKSAQIWDTKDGRVLLTLSGHGGAVRAATFSHDGLHVITASEDGSARIWDARDGRTLLILSGHVDSVVSAAFSPDSSHVVTTSWDRTMRIWATREGRSVLSLSGHARPLFSAEFSPDGSRIVTASEDRTARIWDATDGWTHQLILSGHSKTVRSATFSPDSSRVATASDDGTARIWDAKDGRSLLPLVGHSGPVVSVAFSPDGARVVTAGIDGTARMWDASDGRSLLILRVLSMTGEQSSMAAFLSASFSPDGSRIITASTDGTVRIWDARAQSNVENTERQLVLPVFVGSVPGILTADFSPDGSRIITASEDHTARIWDARDGRTLLILSGHSKAVRSAAFSPDGSRIITASEDRTARIWDARDGRTLLILSGHSKAVRSAAFSPAGDHIVTASFDGTARILLSGPEGYIRYACHIVEPYWRVPDGVRNFCQTYVHSPLRP